jgi:hypothetical protein
MIRRRRVRNFLNAVLRLTIELGNSCAPMAGIYLPQYSWPVVLTEQELEALSPAEKREWDRLVSQLRRR